MGGAGFRVALCKDKGLLQMIHLLLKLQLATILCSITSTHHDVFQQLISGAILQRIC